MSKNARLRQGVGAAANIHLSCPKRHLGLQIESVSLRSPAENWDLIMCSKASGKALRSAHQPDNLSLCIGFSRLMAVLGDYILLKQQTRVSHDTDMSLISFLGIALKLIDTRRPCDYGM